jgi:ABC-type nitrate/sulfonate/bicarbonate transport system permease component
MRGAAPTRRRLEGRGARAALGGVGILCFLTLWEVLSRTETLPSQSFPPATDIIQSLVNGLSTSEVWDAIKETLTGWALGLLIAVPAAVVVGLLIGSSDVLYGMFRAIIEFLRPVPSVALIPLGVLVFGVDMQVKLFLIVYAVFFPMLYQAVYGVRSTDRVALESATVYGLSRRQRALRIVLPSATPHVMTGLRLASSIALVLAVTAELIIGTPGIGELIASRQSLGEYSDMYAFILLTGILGILLNLIFQTLESRVVWWRADRRRAT